MKIQHLTDLHLDINRRADPLARFGVAADADVIALTGDITNHALDTLNFIKYTLLPLTAPHQHIVFVLGNHEFYGCPMEKACEYALDMDHPRIHFLCSGRVFEHEGVCFVGDTLWTDFESAADGAWPVDLSMLRAMECMADFSRIDYRGRVLRPLDTIRFFRETLEAFTRAIQQTDCTCVVVLSHHGPSRRSISPRFTGDVLNTAFVSEVIGRVAFSKPVALWLHGHVHDAFDYEIFTGEGDITRVVCNPLGYLGSGMEGRDFNGGKVMSVGSAEETGK